MKRLCLAVFGLAVFLGTCLFVQEADLYAATRTLKQEETQEVTQEKKSELDEKVCEYFKTYFDAAVTEKSITGRQLISEDYKGKPVTPYVVFALADDSSQYTAIVNEDGSIRYLSAIDNRAASTTVSTQDPYFEEKRAYDLKKITLPPLSKCKELTLDFIAGHHLADDIKPAYVGEITTDMLYSTILYQYDENTLIFANISSQYNKVIGFGYRKDMDQAKKECEAADYRGTGGLG